MTHHTIIHLSLRVRLDDNLNRTLQVRNQRPYLRLAQLFQQILRHHRALADARTAESPQTSEVEVPTPRRPNRATLPDGRVRARSEKPTEPGMPAVREPARTGKARKKRAPAPAFTPATCAGTCKYSEAPQGLRTEQGLEGEFVLFSESLLHPQSLG